MRQKDGPTTPRSTSSQNVNQKVSAVANKTAAVAKVGRVSYENIILTNCCDRRCQKRP